MSSKTLNSLRKVLLLGLCLVLVQISCTKKKALVYYNGHPPISAQSAIIDTTYTHAISNEQLHEQGHYVQPKIKFSKSFQHRDKVVHRITHKKKGNWLTFSREPEPVDDSSGSGKYVLLVLGIILSVVGFFAMLYFSNRNTSTINGAVNGCVGVVISLAILCAGIITSVVGIITASLGN